jgi:peptide/nickel transport system substrate-binding protein
MRAGRAGLVVLLALAACSRGHARPLVSSASETSVPSSCGPALPASRFDPSSAPPAPTPPSERPIVVQLDAEPATLLPLVHPDWLSWTIEGHLVLESLVRVDATTGSLVGELAESWEVDPSRTRWTFRLRKGARWHDGAPVSADDVVFTFDRLLDPTVGSPDRAIFAGARVVKTPGGDVEVKLPAPLASAEIDFDRVLVLPRHRFPRGDLTRAEDASAPVGTGPMRFSSWVRGREIVLVRNPTYWGPPSPTPRMTFRFIASPPAVLAAIEHGDVDVVPRATVELAEQVTTRPALAASYEVVRAGGFDYTAWIHNVTSPKLKDARVRRAIGLAIPRSQLRSEVERCGVQLAPGPLPQGHEALAGIEAPRFDPAEAARSLGEAGIADTNGDGVRDWEGQPFRLTLIYPSSSRQQERAATVIADELRRLGVDLKLSPVEWAEFLHRVEAHDFELASIEWSIDANPDLFTLFHSTQVAGGLNYGGYADADVDLWLDELRSEPRRERRTELLHALVARLRRDEPYTFLFSPIVQAVVRRGALRVTPTALGWQPRAWGWGPALLDK